MLEIWLLLGESLVAKLDTAHKIKLACMKVRWTICEGLKFELRSHKHDYFAT